ncbi:MAG TPA: DUF3891 family protein [Candidatus Limnocylindrales bacterium]|jgi:hypothetical protein|nr:DUF3891 family protein [Candidatus Limnocylindrales bacterium]
MILRPETKPARTNDAFVSAWEAVARAEKTRSAKYHLVRQPDHARVSGEIVQQLAIAGAPPVDDDIVRGISLHDEGWAAFDEGRERLQATPANYSSANVALDREGRPLAFLDIKAGDFLRAWRGSIDSAEAVAPIAALIVSGHFCRLGKFGIGMAVYSEDDARSVREFLASEEQRQCRLLRLQNRSEGEVQYWTDVLQFCDLLSLYLCCGAQESVEFPQGIGPNDETIKLQVQDEVFVLTPSPLVKEVEFSVEAHPYPADAGTPSITVAWRVG